jgi:hypothetical protein
MKDNLVGLPFGRLVVLEAGKVAHSGRKWVCRCACGKLTSAYGFNLKSGKTTSCGCRAKECLGLRRTHGLTHSPEYSGEAWRSGQ